MAKRVLAFALGGGGARGALQVGALRALFEAGVKPDLLVGTSIGAVNAAALAVNGVGAAGLAGLEAAWHDAAAAGLLPASYLWTTVRTMIGRAGQQSQERLRSFLIAHGLTPALRFGDLPGVRLAFVAADLSQQRPVIYGPDPADSVLEGVLASSALPPWVRPWSRGGHWLVDGGLVSNLPIEPALAQGATEIIALDLVGSQALAAGVPGIRPFITRLMATAEQREMDLELALAAAQGVPVHRVRLEGNPSVPIWDFSRTDALFAIGYQTTRSALAGWELEGTRPAWWERREWLAFPVGRFYRRRRAA